MRAASYQHSSYTQRASLRRRGIAFVLALAANILLLTMLLRLGPALLPRPAVRPEPILLRLVEPRVAGARKVARIKPAGGRTARVPLPKPAASAATAPLSMITLSRDEYAASDISKLSPHLAEPGGAGAGAAAGASRGVSEGPGGEQLYDAQWYREPSHAELATYLPAGGAPQGSWGMIACQTVEKYHVDNCRELGDSPPGSGLARAIRQAAWQFLVLPPRIGGRSIVGAWVRIRVDFTELGTK